MSIHGALPNHLRLLFSPLSSSLSSPPLQRKGRERGARRWRSERRASEGGLRQAGWRSLLFSLLYPLLLFSLSNLTVPAGSAALQVVARCSTGPSGPPTCGCGTQLGSAIESVLQSLPGRVSSLPSLSQQHFGAHRVMHTHQRHTGGRRHLPPVECVRGR